MGELLGDTVIATAVLDRLLHHSHVLNIRGESYWLKDKRRAGLCSAGKPKKVALVASIRKLLTILNAMLNHHTHWDPIVAQDSASIS